MPIKLEVGGTPYIPQDKENIVHGIRLGDIGIVWSDETSKAKIVIYADEKKFNTLEDLEIPLNQEPISREVTCQKNGQSHKIKVIFQNTY
jgi:hypothetical protein